MSDGPYAVVGENKSGESIKVGVYFQLFDLVIAEIDALEVVLDKRRLTRVGIRF